MMTDFTAEQIACQDALTRSMGYFEQLFYASPKIPNEQKSNCAKCDTPFVLDEARPWGIVIFPPQNGVEQGAGVVCPKCTTNNSSSVFTKNIWSRDYLEPAFFLKQVMPLIAEYFDPKRILEIHAFAPNGCSWLVIPTVDGVYATLNNMSTFWPDWGPDRIAQSAAIEADTDVKMHARYIVGRRLGLNTGVENVPMFMQVINGDIYEGPFPLPQDVLDKIEARRAETHPTT